MSKVQTFQAVPTVLAGSAAAQGMSALTGLLLARWLPVHDYSIYTIMTVILGAMTLLTKGGVHLGYSALLGRDWPDRTKVEAAGKAVLRLRRTISSIALPPICLAATFLLIVNGAGYAELALLITLLILSWHFDMQTRVLDNVLYYAGQTSRLQILDTALNALRLAMTVALQGARLLSASVAIAVTVAIAAMRTVPVVGWISKVVPPLPDNQPSTEVSAMVRKVALRQMPTELYTVFQPQLVLFLLSLCVGTAAVAEYGALSRISQLLLPVQVLSYSFVIPHFTRQTDRLARRLAEYSLLCAIPAFALVGCAWIAPEYVLLLVGDKYANLTSELFVATLSGALLSSLSITWNLLAHRGWNYFAWLQIPVGLAWCAVAFALFDLGTLSGVLWLQAGLSFGYLAAILCELWAAKGRGEL